MNEQHIEDRLQKILDEVQNPKPKKLKPVDGCGCGCRGDFRITAKGLEFLEKNKK